MSWIGILLIGFAVADLTHSVRRTRFLPECVGALVVLLVGLLAGLTSGRDVVALLVTAALERELRALGALPAAVGPDSVDGR